MTSPFPAALAVALLALVPALRSADGERTFVDVDPARVRAKFKKVEAVTAGEPGCVVQVEVSAPAGFEGHVEPLRFRVTPRGRDAEPVDVARVEPPFHGRAGRAAGSRAALFSLLVPLEARAAKGAKIEVLEVSAWTGGGIPEQEPVEVGRPRSATDFDTALQRSLTRTTIPLRNLIDRDVEVVLSADFIRPRKATSLVRGIVPAGGTLDLVARELPTGTGTLFGAEIRRARLVDWSILEDDGAEEARRLFAEGWDGVYRVGRDRFPLAARFTREVRSGDSQSMRSGTLRLDADGGVTVALDGGLDSAGALSVQGDLERALWCIARPSVAAATAPGVTLMRRGPRAVVRVAENPLRASLGGAAAFVLEGGRLVGFGSPPMAGEFGHANPSVWTYSDGEPARLVGRRARLFRGNPEAYRDLRIDWSRVDGVWLPAVVTTREGEWSPGTGGTTTLTLSGWTPNAVALEGPEPPSGPLADELRSAWDAFYRYPTREARITGSFRARTPGTDGVWIGRKDVRGDFTLEDERDGFWRTSSAPVQGKRLTDDERATLENAVLDRVLMWSGRDLCRAPRFDDAFRGAKLSRDGDWILAPGATVPAVRLARGRVAAVRTSWGNEAVFRWEIVENLLVPVERTSGDEVVRVEWEPLEPGWLFPSRVEFERVFGRDWGPESLEFSKVEVETGR